MVTHSKGARRRRLDLIRAKQGEPKSNFEKNRTPHCHYERDGKAYRLKGRNRFKTGKKRQKPGKKAM